MKGFVAAAEPFVNNPGLVSVVVVTWNSAEYLKRCLEAVAKQTFSNRELVVVDNASSDDSATIAEAHGARVIRNDSNRGFAPAANQGIRETRGAFVLLLNPDCFLEPSFIERILESIGEAGAATGKLLLADGSGCVDSKGIRMTRNGRHLDIEQGKKDSGSDAVAPVFGVSGAAAMYRRQMIDALTIEGEFFDEDFFAYREDADVAWRAQLFGWTAVYVPAAVAYHVRRVTPEVRRSLPAIINMHSVKNRFLLRLKNEGSYLALRNAPFELFRDFVTIAAVLTIERTSIPALTWLWSNRSRIAAKRRAVQSRRRVSDRALARWFR